MSEKIPNFKSLFDKNFEFRASVIIYLYIESAVAMLF